jgi:hypothetical protein
MTVYPEDQRTRRLIASAVLFQKRFTEYSRIHLDRSEAAGLGDLFPLRFRLDFHDHESESELEPELELEAEPERRPQPETHSESRSPPEPGPMSHREQPNMPLLDGEIEQSMTHKTQRSRARHVAALPAISA